MADGVPVPDSDDSGIIFGSASDSASSSSSGAATAFASQLKQAFPVVLPFLDGLVRQASILTAAAGGDIYGTVTAARPSPKPFIVGFIPPTVPVNYIPVKRTSSTEAQLFSGSGNEGPGPENTSTTALYVPPGTPGRRPVTPTPFSNDDLKTKLLAAMTKALGHPPSDIALRMVYAQICLEKGINPNSSTIDNVKNFNLGNVHAYGGGTSPIGGPDPKPPKGGSYYLGTDTDSKGKPYQVYFKSFDSLDAAVASQVNFLRNSYPGTLTATTVEEYNNALIPGKLGKAAPGHNYYEAAPEVYLKGLQRGYGWYKPPGAGGSIASSAAPMAAVKVPPLSNGILMRNGDVCGANEDPLASRLGRGIAPDETRLTDARAYTDGIIHDINVIRSTPPLLMLISPSSFDRSYDRGEDNVTKGRHGPIVSMWIEKPMSISCKGVTAGQYIFDAEGSGGLTQTNRIQSVSYQNLLSLVMIYKNNGIIYDGVSGPGTGLVPAVQMSLYIYYDGRLYIGSFDDFQVDDEADKPYNMGYSFKFNVRYEVELGSQTDYTAAGGL